MNDARYPEFDYSPEERVKAIASILLAGVSRVIAERRRAKTRRWRERTRQSGVEESRCSDGRSEP